MNVGTALVYEDIEGFPSLMRTPRLIASAVFDQATIALEAAGSRLWTDVGSATRKNTVYVALVSAGAIESATVQLNAFDPLLGARTFGSPPPEMRAALYTEGPSAESLATHRRILDNAAAIALIGSWLEEGSGAIDEVERRDLEQISLDLNAERSSSRKLFP